MTATILTQLLNPLVIQNFNTEKGFVVLKEDGKETKFKPMEIHGLDKENTVIFKLDLDKSGFKAKSAYLNPTQKGIHSGCDYVIFTKFQNENIVMFFELKSDEPRGAEKQLLASIPFWEYLSSLLYHHYSIDAKSFKRHYYIFQTKRIAKQTTKYDKLIREQFSKDNITITIKISENCQKIHLAKLLR